MMFLAYPFWRDLHFFIYHVAMHQQPLYRWVSVDRMNLALEAQAVSAVCRAA